MERPIVETRICPICGKEFGITCFQQRKATCSAECARLRYRAFQQDWRKHNKARLAASARACRARKPKREYVCKLCGEKFSTGRGGVPRYCMPCLESLKDKWPWKEYYERRLDAECRKNWSRCFKDAQNSK